MSRYAVRLPTQDGHHIRDTQADDNGAVKRSTKIVETAAVSVLDATLMTDDPRTKAGLPFALSSCEDDQKNAPYIHYVTTVSFQGDNEAHSY